MAGTRSHDAINASTASSSRAGSRAQWFPWPAPRTTSTRPPGAASPIATPSATGLIGSWSPRTTNVGTVVRDAAARVEPLTGPPAEIAEHLRGWEAAGAAHVQLVVDPITYGAIEWLHDVISAF